MHLAAEADAESALAAATELERLRTENRGLRELLGIAGITMDDIIVPSGGSKDALVS